MLLRRGVNRHRIDTTADKDLVSRIWRELVRLVHSGEDEPGVSVGSLSPGLRMLWRTMLLDSDVGNGGFNQYFFNQGEEFVPAAVEGFRLIGAADHAGVVEEAMRVFRAESSVLKPFHEERTIEALFESYEHTTLGRLDDAYTALPDFSSRLVSYIREHPDEFVFEPPRRSLRLAELSRTILMVLAAMLGVPVLSFALVLGVLALRDRTVLHLLLFALCAVSGVAMLLWVRARYNRLYP